MKGRRQFFRAVAGICTGGAITRTVAPDALPRMVASSLMMPNEGRADIVALRMKAEDVARAFNVPIRLLVNVGRNA